MKERQKNNAMTSQNYSAVCHLLFSDLSPSSQCKLLANIICIILNIFILLNRTHSKDVGNNVEIDIIRILLKKLFPWQFDVDLKK
jgi:hypothetical protein